MENVELIEKIHRLKEIKEEKSKTTEQLEEVKKRYDELEMEIFDDMELSDIKSIDVEDVGRVTRSTTIYASVTAENFEKVKQWAEQQGIAEELIQEKFKADRVSVIVRELVKGNKPVPEGIDWYPDEGLSITKAK